MPKLVTLMRSAYFDTDSLIDEIEAGFVCIRMAVNVLPVGFMHFDDPPEMFTSNMDPLRTTTIWSLKSPRVIKTHHSDFKPLMGSSWYSASAAGLWS